VSALNQTEPAEEKAMPPALNIKNANTTFFKRIQIPETIHFGSFHHSEPISSAKCLP